MSASSMLRFIFGSHHVKLSVQPRAMKHIRAALARREPSANVVGLEFVACVVNAPSVDVVPHTARAAPNFNAVMASMPVPHPQSSMARRFEPGVEQACHHHPRGPVSVPVPNARRGVNLNGNVEVAFGADVARRM